MNKKTIYIIIFIALVIGFAVMIYFVFIADLVNPPTNNDNLNDNANQITNTGLPVTNGVSNINTVNINAVTNTSGYLIANISNRNISTSAQGGDTAANSIYDNPILSPTATMTGDGFRFYDELSGKFYYIDKDGNIIELSDQVFPEAESINWSPVDNKAIITFPDQSKIMYDFDQQKQATLPKEWDDIEFSPTGDQLGFINLSSKEDQRWLAVSSPDGSQVQLIEPIGDKANSVDVNWSPSNQVVATYRAGFNASSQEIFLIGLNDENFKSIYTDGRGFEGTWSPDGEQLLYSVFNASTRYNPELFLVDVTGDATGTNEIPLGLRTWSFKCTFSKNSPLAFCAVPALLPIGAGISPDIAGDTNDRIYMINTNNGDKQLLALPYFFDTDQDYNIGSMFLNNSETVLYFTDIQTNRLYSINL